MKTKSLILLAVLMMGVGCAKEKRTINEEEVVASPILPTAGPLTPITTTTTTSSTGTGNTTTFKIESLAVLQDYEGPSRAISNPFDFKIKVDFNKTTTGYSGSFRILFKDNGTNYEEVFSTGTGKDSVKQIAVDVYNQWWDSNNDDDTDKFHAFASDNLGAAILVIDEISVVDFGDGGGRIVKGAGSVWYKNFDITRAPMSGAKCWFITLGPYSCTTFMVGDRVETYSAVYPSDGYQKLGTFKDLELAKAFNRE